ncbi:MAG: NB-ARC domain-containing protein, partial [Pseudomonadota bacterium]
MVRNSFPRQQDLAEDIGLSRDTINKFFNGKPVGYLNFLEICGKLGLNLKEIADFSDDDGATCIQQNIEILNNLPQVDYSRFIGRQTELQDLLKLISPEYRQHITIVEGIGGIGKTALVLEAAYLCLTKDNKNSEFTTPQFEAIIFTSAKDSYLNPFGLLKRPIKQENLLQIYSIISDVLDAPFIKQAKGIKNQTQLVYGTLSNHNTLLIVDNMETMKEEDKQEVLSFLSDLPSSTQAVITTRRKIVLYNSIFLESLSEKHSLQLIQQQAKEKNTEISQGQSKKLYDRFGGVPLALIYTVGQKASGYSLETILDKNSPLPEDIARFCFNSSVEPLQEKNEPAYRLLISISIFPNSFIKEAIAVVSEVTDSVELENGLAKLQQLSLLKEEEGRYKMLTLTREYSSAELNNNLDFKTQAYKNWVNWYLNFTQKYGGKDWEGWRTNYQDYLDPEWHNIEGVLNWCADNNYYDEFKELWINVDAYIDINGYWKTRRQRWTWLTEQSQQRGDLPMYVKSKSEESWTLTLMPGDHKDEAYQLLLDAWKLKHEADDETKISLAIHFAVFYMGKRIKEGIRSLKQGLAYLDMAQEWLYKSNLADREMIRLRMRIDYYRAEIHYWQWEIKKKTGNQDKLKQAQIIFEEVIAQGKEIGWQRFTNYAQNWLADILIELKQFEKAEELLISGLFVATQNKEHRRIGHHNATFARLEKARNNKDLACAYAIKALTIFENQDIRLDVQ